MRDLRVLPGFVAGCGQLVEMAAAESQRFVTYPSRAELARRGTGHRAFDPTRHTEDEEQDQYHVLPGNRMSQTLRTALLDALAVPADRQRRFYVQLIRYGTGDFVLPHRDEVAQGVIPLTTSRRDGLVVEATEATFVKVPDVAGTLLLCDPRAWHWVDPVQDGPRFSLVTIPPPA
ncbi:MAG: hypothetical protein AVDCRST_MAG85-4275 [uncultured Solirubrobacteraceae bacterium]|uniref:Prolyl 4-hydroxylase alpha subunit Fe(2+) 2OG dioxygenase domain-containing protein n=1 Tax=uncultured Solirubrobacteraceae bacterium TaxID=1162706 RepID=A0A6J4U3A6_9ACTN|nr:MAG: hypothetical protein AVDCRST_MAG85-4275 [uncultured Solirubrobacteraceae bacterium]